MRSHRRLRTVRHVKGGLAHLIREMEAGRIDPKTGNALTYAYAALANVMQADVGQEIAELRTMLTALQGPARPSLPKQQATPEVPPR